MRNSSKIEKNQENFKKLPNGQSRFAKNNKIGRMRKRGFTLADLNKVVIAYEKTHDETILKHYVEQLMIDNKLLDKYIDRNVPVKTINELTGVDGSPLIFIVEKTYKQVKSKEIDKKDEI